MTSKKRKKEESKGEPDNKPPCFSCGRAGSARGKHTASCWAYLVSDGEEVLTALLSENSTSLSECMKGVVKAGDDLPVVDTKVMGTLQSERPKLLKALDYVKEQKATLMRAPSIKQQKVPYDLEWSASTGLLTITWNGIATVLDGDVIAQTRVSDGGSSL